MSTNSSLATLLRALRGPADPDDVSGVLGSAAALLGLLTNHLNVTLLTSQILTAPSLWERPDGLRTVVRILGVFNSTMTEIIRRNRSNDLPDPHPHQRLLTIDEWCLAVVRGADEKSPRWRHLCVFSGLLLGLQTQGDIVLSASVRNTLQSATVKAIDLYLHGDDKKDELAANSTVMMLSFVFDLLDHEHKISLDHELLLSITVNAAFFSQDGLHFGYFLSSIDSDVVQVTRTSFDWSAKSSTYAQLQQMASQPLTSSLGTLSRIMAFSLGEVRGSDALASLIKDLASLSRSLLVQWQQNKLSEIDAVEESEFLTEESMRSTLPTLWQLLRSAMFAIVIVLRSILGRVLEDGSLPPDFGPFVAIQTLITLRNIYFISSRSAQTAFSQYQFVFLSAIDILSHYPIQAEAFLRDINPKAPGKFSDHPLDRCLDLYFLNVAEHMTALLSPDVNETLLLEACRPYLGIGSDARLREIFEAAHSVTLSVLSAPQNSELVSRHIHQYLDVVFETFPIAISPRQFRMAIKNLVKISSPPFSISTTEPLLPSLILEMVRSKIEPASAAPLAGQSNENSAIAQQPSLSEKASYQLAVIDSLPLLPLHQLEDWLELTAASLAVMNDPNQHQIILQRFWEVLSNGEMDIDRASLCLAWWGTRGGREAVARRDVLEQEGALMSGALMEQTKL